MKNRLANDAEYTNEYTSSMKDMLTKGYAEEVPEDELHVANDQVWYIPHHAIYHPRKEKMRIVFDCSAVYGGHSLNEHLPGPGLINNLTGILCRFRIEQVATTCDTEGMFMQVNVIKSHRNLLRFLW